MYLLYLDESGNPDGAADRFFVLAGAAVFERQAFFLSRALDDVQARQFPGLPPVDFHASPIRSGKDFWRTVTQEKRTQVLAEIAAAIAESNERGVVLFGAAIEKSDQLYGEDAVKRATAECCRRFDMLLSRRYFEEDNAQRGLVIFAEGRFDQRAKVWVRDFRKLGTEWGVLNNLADIPYFASAKETRLLQVADFVAHALFLHYERNDSSLLRPILGHFDRKDGILHGLVHVRTNQSADQPACACPACASRRRPGDLGVLMQPELL